MNIALLNMLQVSDSVFPIGAFTLSNGLETFVQEEKLKNCSDLRIYLKNYISFMPYNELGFFYHTYNDIIVDEKININELIQLDNLYSAFKISSQIRKGSVKLCQRFIKLWEKIEKIEALQLYQELIKSKECEGHHVIALALFAKSKSISFEESANIYAYSVISGVVTNAVKSVPLSQLEGQVVLNENLESIRQAVEKAKFIEKNELGVCGNAFDIYAMKHETLYSRLYMS